jgi:hypothetical protein
VSEVFSLCTEGCATDFLNLEVLTSLRNQLTIKFGEEPVQPQDERLALARSWLETAPGAHAVFSIWESTTEVRGRIACFCLIRSEGILAAIVSSRAVDLGSVVSSDHPVNAVHASQVRPLHSEDVAISGLPRLFELLSNNLA